MIRKVVSGLRSRALQSRNVRSVELLDARLPADSVASFIIVTPEVVHLAPLAARNAGNRITPVFVMNGVTAQDEEWLRRTSPDVPSLTLATSFRGSEGTLLHHGDVIEAIARGFPRDEFCLQDADCFVMDSSLWNDMVIDATRDYAAGPFARQAEDGQPAFPETFLLLLNASLMRRLRRESGITANATETPSRQARELLASAGYPEGKFLETRKPYFDTLQQFWIAARHAGYQFREVPGAPEKVLHVGGTSYLHRESEDLSHWDYWPLNVHYFHLRLLELPHCAPFRTRFRKLIDLHSTADALLESHPDYANGWRRRESEAILAGTGAVSLYADAY